MKKKRSESYNIGVTGHRSIPDDARLRHSIRQALGEIYKNRGLKDVYLISALAEGSDQLVATIAQELNIEVCVPLPKSLDNYFEDFFSDAGIEGARGLLATAVEIIYLSNSDASQDAYERLGEFLVKHSDVLLAVWNGVYNQKTGGTGEVVKHALALGVPVYWIYCEYSGDEKNSTHPSGKQIGDIELLINPESNQNCRKMKN